VKDSIGQSGVVLEVPWDLQGFSMPLPKELSGKVSQWTWLGREADGLHVMATRVVYAPGMGTSLDGAADGMVKNVEAIPGTRSMVPRRTQTRLLGHRAIEVDLEVHREKGEPLRMHGIVVLRGQELIQVLSMARADQPLGEEVWVRIRDSIRSE
jgi:hypothetical protein